MKMMPFKSVVDITNLWKAAGGSSKIEFGALEPLLWHDRNHSVSTLVKSLGAEGNKVKITTNGSLLEKQAEALAEAGVAGLRISWHTTDKNLFKEISGGVGDYQRFYHGICAASEKGIPISFNRVLLRGFTHDLGEQLDFVDRFGQTLKLYDLLWTPDNQEFYKDYYVHWREAVNEHVLPRVKQTGDVRKDFGRSRIRYELLSGGIVEVKDGDNAKRTTPCTTCVAVDNCLESFGDYVRVTPDSEFYLCYQRKDIGFNIATFAENTNVCGFRSALEEILYGRSVDEFLRKCSLRFTLVGGCNFNCRIPGTDKSWCMEKVENDYVYPLIRPSQYGGIKKLTPD